MNNSTTKKNDEKDIQLMRQGLCDLIYPHSKSKKLLKKHAHAGLLLQRGLKQWKNDATQNKSNHQDPHQKTKYNPKSELIKLVSKLTYCTLYEKAYTRWLEHTADENRFAFTSAKIVGRLYIGLSSATALETGITTHHTYGMPMIPGSSVKGAVRAFAENIGIEKDILAVLFGNDEEDKPESGAVVWHDAWWIPNSGSPFVEEIITTHHQAYYNGTQEIADEMESPIPNQQIATQGSFYFVVEGVNAVWAKFANQLLVEMLQQQGMGSKTASGYGYFKDLAGQIQSLEE